MQLRGDETLAERLCEAYFYLGKYSQRQQQWTKAANYFKLALTLTCMNLLNIVMPTLSWSKLADNLMKTLCILLGVALGVT